MIPRRLALHRIALKVGLYTSFTSAFWLAFWLRFRSTLIPVDDPSLRLTDYLLLYFVAVVAWGAFSRLLQLDHLWVASDPDQWIRSGVWATTGTLMVVFFAAFFIRAYSFSRLFVVLLGALNVVALGVTLRILLNLARRGAKRGEEIKVLIVGDHSRAEEIAGVIARNSWVQCDVVGYLGVDGEPSSASVRRLGRLEDLESICREFEPDEILVAVTLFQVGRVAELKRALARVSVPSRLVCDFLKEVGAGDNILDFFGMPVVELHHNPGDSLIYGLLKRSFDVLVASVLLVVLLPLMILIAILVKLTSPGPVFFSQERVGLHGRPFILYKFRTMQMQSQQSSDVIWTTADDDRCTALGVLLRKSNFDELPQLWNVLRGDMSLVGPRPERPFFVDKFAEEFESYNVRHFLKSGITGWAQVNGFRGDTSIAKRVEYDLYYLTHWSFTMDLKILWLTLWKGFRDKNAY
jgi:Undecaprenyl-phosphate glucose phosphotransferase